MSDIGIYQQSGSLVHNSLAMKNTLRLFGIVLIASSTLCAESAKPMPVEVWTGGDDGLTQRLRFELENKFKSSPEFALSSGKKPGTLIVTIPTHVAWTAKGARAHVQYKVEFSSADGNGIGKSSGSCWEEKLSDCADQIYRGAQKAAKRH